MIPRNAQIALVVLLTAVFGMLLYGLHLKSQAEQARVAHLDTRHVAPPLSGNTAHALVLVADDATGQLHRRDISTALPAEPSLRARELLRALFAIYLEKGSTHPLGPGADVNAVFIVNGGTVVVDLNSAFADGHRSGVLVEELTLASIAETLAANLPSVARVRFLVDGKERETLAGHADLMDFYEINPEAGAVAGNAAPKP